MKQRLNWPVKKILPDMLFFTAGTFVFSIGLYTFALYGDFAPGGISGLAIIVNHYTGWPLGLVQLALNVPLVFLSFRVIGATFLAKSLATMAVNTIWLDVVFPHLPAYTGNLLLAAVFSGICIGAGMAIIYMRGGSTGGTDFLTLSIKKKWPHFSVGTLTFFTDAVVILLGGVAFGNIDAVLYGIVASAACTIIIDNMLSGAGSAKLAIIITNHGKAIANAISEDLERGSTLVEATGTYTGERREMLYCACGRSEIYRVRMAARTVDPDSLIMITDASDVIGEGFVPPPIPGNND